MKRILIIIFIATLVGVAMGTAGMWSISHYKTHVENAQTEKEKTDEALAEYTLFLMVFTGILAIATIGLGAATVGLYMTGEKQVELTRKALVGDQRAWLTTSLEIGEEGLTTNHGVMSLDVKLKVINLGRTPAINAHTNMLLVERYENEDVLKFAAKNKVEHPHSLFLSPNDSYYRPWYPSLEQDDRYKRGATRGVQPVLYGCVTYRILQDEELHQIAFVYLLGRKDGSPWGSSFSFLDGPWSSSDIIISPWAGGFAT